MDYFAHRSKNSTEIKNFSSRSINFNHKIKSISRFDINLNEIHDILQKNIDKKTQNYSSEYRSSSKVEKYKKTLQKFSLTKNKLSPCLYRPLTIRCQSPTLRLKYSKPKIVSCPNSFIVTKLTKPKKSE